MELRYFEYSTDYFPQITRISADKTQICGLNQR